MTSISDTLFIWISKGALLLLIIFWLFYKVFKWSDKEPENENERAMKIYKRLNDKK